MLWSITPIVSPLSDKRTLNIDYIDWVSSDQSYLILLGGDGNVVRMRAVVAHEMNRGKQLM